MLPDYDFDYFKWETNQDETCTYNEEPELSTAWREYGRLWDTYLLELKALEDLKAPLKDLKDVYDPLLETYNDAVD